MGRVKDVFTAKSAKSECWLWIDKQTMREEDEVHIPQ